MVRGSIYLRRYSNSSSQFWNKDGNTAKESGWRGEREKGGRYGFPIATGNFAYSVIFGYMKAALRLLRIGYISRCKSGALFLEAMVTPKGSRTRTILGAGLSAGGVPERAL